MNYIFRSTFIISPIFPLFFLSNSSFKLTSIPITQLQEEVEKQYQLYRNEADARKMLVSDIIELKYRVDAPAMKSDSGPEKDDTTLIKFKLKLVSNLELDLEYPISELVLLS